MKKTLAAVFLLMALWTITSAASVSVVIPEYECVINESSVYYENSTYPLISYRDITYFPMTYDYCRAMGLSSSWVEGKGLYIAYSPVGGELPIYETYRNKKTESAVVPQYPIYINGRLIDNKNTDYPLLNFRNVTYFPMTYDYANNEFNWRTEWIPGKFTIQSNAQNDSWIEVLNTDASGADLLCYYYDANAENEQAMQYKRLDYATGIISNAEKKGEDGENDKYSDAEVNINSENGAVSYGGTQIIEPQEFTEDKSTLLDYGFSAMAAKYTYGDITFLEVERFFRVNRKDGTATGSRRQYLYLLDGEKPVFIGNESNVIQAARINEDIYIGVKTYAQTVSRHYLTRKLMYKYTPGAAPVQVEFDDYKSIKLIGGANGKLYLKCEWAPENVMADVSGYHLISAVNDGYFTYDGKTLVKIADYIYSDDDLFSQNGDVYALINWKQEIKKIN